MDVWTLEFEAENGLPSPYWGSLMHGMLIERLPEKWRALAHASEPRPFSQWVETLGGRKFRWHITALAPELGDALASAIDVSPDWQCAHMHTVFQMLKRERATISIREYMKSFYLSDKPAARLKLSFLTTTTHKTQGEYALYPTVDLIARSLRARLCAIEPTFVLAEDDVLEQIISHTRIVRYRLQSGSFALEGARVQGYTGDVVLSVRGPDPMMRLASTLYFFAPYCGVGIKTALGMGACTVEALPERS